MRNAQRLNKYTAVISLMLLFISQQLFAACSSYVGLASINEVSKYRSNGRNHANDLVELKLLDTNIPYSVYSNWRIRICENSGSGCTSQISVSSFSDTTPPWLVLKGATLPGDYISFDDGFDILFTDASGNTIDYLTYDSYQPQKDSSCFATLPYDTASGKSGGGEKRIRRKPDGTGDWDFVTAQSTGDTEDDTNDDVPSNAPSLTVADITVAAGDTAVFTLTLDASYGSNITVDYETVDGTAISGVDYTGTTTTQTVTIPAGSTTTTISIPTASAGSGVFRLLISNASAAVITDQIAEATIDVPSGPDHFDIDHNTNAIYCLNTPVTVTAENADNTTYEDYNGTITLDTNSGIGTWTLLTGEGSFNDATANDGIATYTYSNVIGADDNGVAVFNLDHGDTDTTVPLSINISADDGSASDDDLEGNLNFSESGFTITGSALVNNPPNTIDTNLSVVAQTAGSDFAIHIAAFGTTPSDPSCGVIESYQGVKSLNFAHSYADPTTGSLLPTINGNAISSAIDVTFVSGQASITEKYKDVGQILLTVTDGSTAGSSNPFVVKPASFEIQIAGNPAATDASGNAFITAGTDFPVTVLVLDAEGDITPNYGNESAPESVSLSHALVGPGPIAAEAGILSGSLTKTADGTYTGNYSWDEVGIIALTAGVASSDYLGAGNVTTTLDYVGRFTPHHFIVDTDAILPGGSGYSYLGQEFIAQYEIHAVNANGVRTKNYTGLYNKLDINSQISYGAVDDVGVSLNSRLTPSAIIATMADGKSGVISVPLTIARNASAVDDPFNDVVVGLLITDSDGISQLATALDIDTVAPTGDDHQQLGSTPMDLYYGRVYIPPAYGPETPAGSLDLPFELQYWDGTAFVTNTNDSDSRYDAWTYTCDDPDPPTADTLECYVDAPLIIPGAPATVSGGLPDSAKHITITRPGAGNTGSLEFTLTVDSWLQYDWDADGTFSDNPSARVTFGSYRGHDKIIYWRETE
ncbi:DUF6701 domain-containing protein [Dasania marina]|uniref:DUF6701 domain-containing protein n=1 Tax=Dasania marina TaxID=471499 RepID=UPI00036A9C87|nr:DUF6701 domain-containing protein [Dasania marina]